MGGNSRAVAKDGKIREWRGKPALAEKIDLHIIPRFSFQFEMKTLCESLNEYFSVGYGQSIWTNSALESNIIFNGSSSVFMDDGIDDIDFIAVKPKIGDIDITVPKNIKNNFWKFLSNLEGVQLTENIIYVGSNKPTESSVGEQINSVLEFIPTQTLFQIDWEFVDFKNDEPDNWAKFSKSANWNDMQLGIKGVFHKYLLRALTRTCSRIANIAVVTPSCGTASIDELERLNAIISKNQPGSEMLIREYHKIRPKLSKPYIDKSSINQYSFSVLYGLRDKICFVVDKNSKPLMVTHTDGSIRQAIRLRPVDQSEYISDIPEMFKIIFNRVPTLEDLEKFNSFVGLAELMEPNSTDVMCEFIELLWGINPNNISNYNVPTDLKYAGQALERDDWEIDKANKLVALSYLIDNTKTYMDSEVIKKIIDIYYGKKGQAYLELRTSKTQ